jgi:hypothetical protein
MSLVRVQPGEPTFFGYVLASDSVGVVPLGLVPQSLLVRADEAIE